MKQEKENQVRESWQAYLEDIDSQLSDILKLGVDTSLYFFLSETGDQLPILPLFELVMELHEPDIVYVPSADPQEPNNFCILVEALVEDIYSMIKPMERVDPENKEITYYDIAKADNSMEMKSDELAARIIESMKNSEDYMKEFEEYIILWTEDRHEFLRQFLLYSRPLTLEELDLLDNEDYAIKETPPTIAQFKEQIDYYENLYKKVEEIPLEKILMNGWLKIDVKPLRQAILNTVCKWSNLFKQHLYNKVIDSLEELENFIREAISAMQVQYSCNDLECFLFNSI